MCTNLLKANRLLIWYPDPSRVKKNMGYKISPSPGSSDVTSLVTMATKNFWSPNSKIFIPFERAWKTEWKKGHNLYLKINISRYINKRRSKNDVIDDVIGDKKVVKIKKFSVLLKEDLLRNKKYYYEKAWKWGLQGQNLQNLIFLVLACQGLEFRARPKG